MGFYIYVIAFDQDVFGAFASEKEAEEALEKQINSGGPAWDKCEVERWLISGTPEFEVDEPLVDDADEV